MADPLSRRIENVIDGLIEAVLPDEQALVFGQTTAAEKDYIATTAVRVGEDPLGSGVFLHDGQVVAHGNFTQANLHALEELFDGATTLGNAIRTAASGSFVVAGGQCVELDAGPKTGAGLDLEHRFTFGLWAQAQEVSDAA